MKFNLDEVRNFLKKASISELKKLPEGFYILVHHFRGKTVHLDFRIKKNHHLNGMTILTAIPGEIQETVKDIKKAQQLSETMRQKFYPQMDSTKKVGAIEKRMHPLEWFTVVEDIFPPGSIGSTKFEEGVFFLYDAGQGYFGVDKPYFREYWWDGVRFQKKRIIFRMLEILPEWKESFPKQTIAWFCWVAKEDTPYILFHSLDEIGFVPVFGKSYLPPWWEEKIKSKYWHAEDMNKRIQTLFDAQKEAHKLK